MAEHEVVTTTERTSSSTAVANIVSVIVGLLEILLAFRFIFMLLGANPASGFVNFIYSVSRPFVVPFYGIFGEVTTTKGAVTTAVFDPATLVAMAVYAVIGWVILRLLTAHKRPVA